MATAAHVLHVSCVLCAVCHDKFDNKAAGVVCRELGMNYTDGVALYGNDVASGSGNVWLDNVVVRRCATLTGGVLKTRLLLLLCVVVGFGTQCAGNEASVLNCSHSEWTSMCTHASDVGKLCLHVGAFLSRFH